jgi:uncharacterized protein
MVLVGACCVPIGALAVSFDCPKATTLAEKAICNSTELSALDDTLADAYKKAVQDKDEMQRKQLMLEQRQWMRIVRDRCATDACLAAAYKIRLVVLRDGTDPVSGSGERDADKEWLWRFQYQIHDVLMPADKYHVDRPISLNDVVVVTYDTNRKAKRKSYLESLEIAEEPNDVDHFKIEPLARGAAYGKGCLFYVGDPIEAPAGVKMERDGAYCGELRKRAAGVIAADRVACKELGKKYAVSNKYKSRVYREFVPYLFVDTAAQRAVCYIGSKPFQEGWYETSPNNTQTISYLTGWEISEDIPSYLGLDSNRIFGCQNYGAPTQYWRTTLPMNAALPIIYPGVKAVPVWEHHYLILTSGYHSGCSNATILIDEPKYASFRINDGTVLMRGNRSLLRLWEKDGSTQAPNEYVRTLNPKEVRLALDRFDTRRCMGDWLAGYQCSMFTGLGWKLPHLHNDNDPSQARFNTMVIEAVDTALMRSFIIK